MMKRTCKRFCYEMKNSVKLGKRKMRDVVASPDGVGSFHLLLASFYEREKKGKLEMAFFVFFLVNFSGERWKGGGG